MDFFEDSSASPAPAGDFASAPLEDFGDFGGASPAPAEAGGDFFGSPAGSFEAAAPATGSLDGSFEGSSFDAPAAGDSFGGSFEAAPVDAAQGSFDAGSFGSGSGSFGADSGSFDAAPAAASSFEGSFDAGVGEAPAPVVASDSFGGSFEGSSFEATPAAAEPIMDSSFEAPAEVAPIDAFAATPVAVEEAAAPASPMSSFGAVQVTSDLMRYNSLALGLGCRHLLSLASRPPNLATLPPPPHAVAVLILLRVVPLLLARGACYSALWCSVVSAAPSPLLSSVSPPGIVALFAMHRLSGCTDVWDL